MRNRCLQPLLSCLKTVVSSPLGCFSFRPNQSSSSPDGYFLNSGSFLLLSFSPHQACIFLKALLPKTGPVIRAEQGRASCHPDRAPVAVQLHRSQITQHRWPRLTLRIPRSSLHKVLPPRTQRDTRPLPPLYFIYFQQLLAAGLFYPLFLFLSFCILERRVVINTQIGVLTAGVGLGLWGGFLGWGWRVLFWGGRRIFGCIHQTWWRAGHTARPTRIYRAPWLELD